MSKIKNFVGKAIKGYFKLLSEAYDVNNIIYIRSL